MIRPVCMHFFFSNCLEFLGSTWFLNDFTKAREWVNSELVPLLLATRKPDGKLTLLDFLAAAPLALLVYSNSSMVQEAASSLPALRDWLQQVIGHPTIRRTLDRRQTATNAK